MTDRRTILVSTVAAAAIPPGAQTALPQLVTVARVNVKSGQLSECFGIETQHSAAFRDTAMPRARRGQRAGYLGAAQELAIAGDNTGAAKHIRVIGIDVKPGMAQSFSCWRRSEYRPGIKKARRVGKSP